ncbi:hypothetical protein VE01_05456 [Pseudogymnoascus verrucosus]|uniref:Uncharacterized protein n=1 Tax=Pseudogymnoascus verrucosus TaxID=342668 RepID=A0A1B8GMD4_9PEZI|nr:uncharacterized protein VE01_05456 [Pseudogymnoascus verrucosus]OBT96948.1 hypothetical protein VE01_05456 [Pseudogymnoascus verrucosus]
MTKASSNEAPTFENCTQIATIIVGVEKKKWRIPTDLLCFHPLEILFRGVKPYLPIAKATSARPLPSVDPNAASKMSLDDLENVELDDYRAATIAMRKSELTPFNSESLAARVKFLNPATFKRIVSGEQHRLHRQRRLHNNGDFMDGEDLGEGEDEDIEAPHTKPAPSFETPSQWTDT